MAEKISAAYFRDFLPHTLTDIPPPDEGLMWQCITREHAARLVRKYPNPSDFWTRAIAYIEKNESAGAPPEWGHRTWCLLEDAWWSEYGCPFSTG